ncbi:MAG: acyl carrier protein [Verrucomicrobia bacterium]|nr:MAG: acyl carrier protein [Verrucomicrobiota bacterium]
MRIEDKIRDFILKNLYFAQDHTLADDVSFLGEGIIDSMGAMELVAFVESEFGIKVDMSEVVVKNFDSVGQLANFVRRKLPERELASSKSTETVAELSQNATAPHPTVTSTATK